MARAFVYVLDSFGIGGAPDAKAYGDLGADTLGHIAEFCAAGLGDRSGLREGSLHLPNMAALGLLESAKMSTGNWPAGMVEANRIYGRYAAASEVSRGKDTPSGHWEIAGTPVRFDWGYFPDEEECFSEALLSAIFEEAGLEGSLGNCHASGTDIIQRFGQMHIWSGKPIFYTSADSVFQIAAHEYHFGLERLLQLCEIVRRHTYDYNIGRVIARPFVGETAETFKRTGNRRDFSISPPEETLLDRLVAAGRDVIAVGKISDIFAGKGVTHHLKADGNEALVDASLRAIEGAHDGSLVFTNLVDFDMVYGHRRDVPGYAAALEAFDARIGEITKRMKPGDLLCLTADHGCDPTWRGSDHTRERVPALMFGAGIRAGSAGIRSTYADIGESIAHHLKLAPGQYGTSFL
ncbi:phosphopentomutase [Martelella mediterranea]|uniref:Phosphopentomutase n=1 Tax=Martelella mediterranea TaxID=293089 RepID=A0A4R3NUD5_9HYPH|nr:phosphopentomutase [Martelella mediterranea]TCT42058.1 phosphopentomutase [Martelella mediterranea]